MRIHPNLQFGSPEFPMTKIVIGGYAPSPRPALDSLRMKVPEDGSCACAIKKRFKSLSFPLERDESIYELLAGE
jgi:hypothetical protein